MVLALVLGSSSESLREAAGGVGEGAATAGESFFDALAGAWDFPEVDVLEVTGAWATVAAFGSGGPRAGVGLAGGLAVCFWDWAGFAAGDSRALSGEMAGFTGLETSSCPEPDGLVFLRGQRQWKNKPQQKKKKKSRKNERKRKRKKK